MWLLHSEAVLTSATPPRCPHLIKPLPHQTPINMEIRRSSGSSAEITNAEVIFLRVVGPETAVRGEVALLVRDRQPLPLPTGFTAAGACLSANRKQSDGSSNGSGEPVGGGLLERRCGVFTNGTNEDT